MALLDKEQSVPIMPDLVGNDLHRALRLLELAGIKDYQWKLVPAEENRGKVVEQWPDLGTPVEPDIQVRFHVEEENPIRFLPEVFADEDELPLDSVGADRPSGFLRNFLYIPQQLFSGIESKMVNMHRMLSPEGATDAFLPWLADLFPLEMDAGWPPERVRAVLREARALLKLRGTAEGLKAMIALYAGVDVELLENGWPHKGMIVGGEVELPADEEEDAIAVQELEDGAGEEGAGTGEEGGGEEGAGEEGGDQAGSEEGGVGGKPKKSEALPDGVIREKDGRGRKRYLKGSRIGEAAIVSTVPQGDDAFLIELPAEPPVSQAQLERLLRVVDAEKPVNLRCAVVRKAAPPQYPEGKDAIGYAFVIGKSLVSGPVVTPPARLGVKIGSTLPKP